MNRILLPFILPVLFSCSHQKASNVKARYFFDSVNYEIKTHNGIQQELIGKITESVLALKDDPDANFDTREFSIYLDSAMEQNLLMEKNIEHLTEVDNTINYKEKTLDYIRLFNSFYTNELATYIKLLDNKQEDRASKGGGLILPKLKLIKETETSLKNARSDFETAYPLPYEEHIVENADFEFIPFEDFEYSPINLQQSEPITVLSFSGGPYCDQDHNYYKQFIGIVKSTGDTIRVLALCQDYDITKSNRIGYFQVPAATDNKIPPNRFVEFNKKQAELEKGTFKTAIGTLGFKEQ